MGKLYREVQTSPLTDEQRGNGEMTVLENEHGENGR